MKPLTLEEKIHIVHQVLVDYQTHSEVAQEHRVSKRVVGYLVSKA